ncbi:MULTISPECIES: hypothetical protein [unclassified Streptomyces]|uniref:hypothetical protein n=1 Tax=unclassified Streptomyces TaxID=2593676 RepID=UPI000DAB7F58|nr:MULTISPECIES: hypothetical protein [unclassified Streptomyces]PZT75178.1 hypothetical protein DNK55_24555 [Streptomyces sp. AC1-42T]PZT81839.1 hypothetical protein DNK56_06890 [Streptomyces sp. AC1-42W]
MADTRRTAGPAFHRLTFVPEGDEVLVGRTGTDSYALFPADGALLLHKLTTGMPLAEAVAWYNAAYDEPVDMDAFLETLDDLGFLLSEGEEPAPEEPAAVRYERLGRAVFSPAAWIVYAAVAVVCVVLLVRMPDVRPYPRTLFFTESLLLVQVGLLFAQLPFVFLHESFHALAGRRIGIPSSLGVGRRLYFVVFETTLNGLLGVPKKKRYLPFLAGMVADTLVFCLLVFAAALDAHLNGNELTLIGRFAVALAFATALRFVWQFYLFLRTDLYYVFSTALGCVALHDTTRALIRNTGCRLLGLHHRMVDLEQWSERDRRVARWYAPFAAVGVLVMLLTAALTAVPVLAHFVRLLVDRLGRAGDPDSGFWDTVGFLVLSVVQFGLAGVVALRDRSRARAEQRLRQERKQNGNPAQAAPADTPAPEPAPTTAALHAEQEHSR